MFIRVKAEWRGRTIHDIKRADVVRLLDDIAVTAPVWANRHLSHIGKFFKWLSARGVIEVSPCTEVEKPTKEISRDRVLTSDELAMICWGRLRPTATPMGRVHQAFDPNRPAPGRDCGLAAV